MFLVAANTRQALVGQKEWITTGSSGIQVQFLFSDDWEGLSKFAVFRNAEIEESKIPIALTESNLTELPAENCAAEYVDEKVYVGVYGSDGLGHIIIPTIWVSLGVLKEGAAYEGMDPPQPTPDMWAQILAIAQNAGAENAEEAEKAADEAKTAVTHYPKIVDRYWYVWNAETETWVNTEIQAEGQNGYSPEVTITEIEGGHRVTITDEDHPQGQTFDVMDGQGGSTGNYDELTNRPRINGHTLTGNQSADDLGLGTYSKPASGIPKTDLASDVKASLGKADTALQTAPVQSVAGKTGAVNLGAGDVGFNSSEEYNEGTVGAKLSALNRQLNDLEDDKQDAPETAGTAGQVLGLDSNLNPTWMDQTGDANVDTDKVEIPYTTTPGYIKYTDGTYATSSLNSCTDYIDVSNYDRLLYSRFVSTSNNPSSGCAFYDSEKNYISGVQSVKSGAEYNYFSELAIIDVPTQAKYARFTTLTDEITYGKFEIYYINEAYYEYKKSKDLEAAYLQSSQVVPLSALYYDKFVAYRNSADSLIDVEKNGNHYVLNGSSPTGDDIRIKISNDIQETYTSGAVTNFKNPISLKIGHQYKISIQLVSGDAMDEAFSVSVYKPGASSSVGTGYRVHRGYVRTFTADQENFNVCIYVNRNNTLTDAEFIIELTDLTGDFVDATNYKRIYTSPTNATIQSGVVLQKMLYAYGNNTFYKVNLCTGERENVTLNMSHGNDMAVYAGKLYVCSMNDTGEIYVVNPNTKAIESTVIFKIDGVATYTSGIAYDKVHNQFVLKGANGEFYFATTSLAYKSTIIRNYLSGATSQGIECDGYYIYAVEYNPNHIDVYDYSGAWITSIVITSGDEPEGLYFAEDGTAWLVTNVVGGYKWHIDEIKIRSN